MKNYTVEIWDRAIYEVDAETSEYAELQAQEWFAERKPNITISEGTENAGDIFDYLLDILAHRAKDDERDINMRLAYDNALTMLAYALHNDWVSLGQFDDRDFE